MECTVKPYELEAFTEVDNEAEILFKYNEVLDGEFTFNLAEENNLNLNAKSKNDRDAITIKKEALPSEVLAFLLVGDSKALLNEFELVDVSTSTPVVDITFEFKGKPKKFSKMVFEDFSKDEILATSIEE